jgi:AcrR family transcriptional regulator
MATGKRTGDRVLDAALASFATRGYEATSLDALAKELGVRKQTILYWFPSKEALLDAVIDRSAVELSGVLEQTVASSGPGWERIDAIVRAVFRMAIRRPELLGLLREVSRLGPPTSTRLVGSLSPLVEKATLFLEHEMDAGRMRRTDPGLLLMSVYSTVIGMATEVEVLRAVGIEPTLSAAIKRRTELLDFLRSALLTPEQLAAEGTDGP